MTKPTVTGAADMTREMPDPSVKPTLSVEEAAVLLGIGKNQAYSAVQRGDIPSLRVGRRLLVPTASLRKLVGIDA